MIGVCTCGHAAESHYQEQVGHRSVPRACLAAFCACDGYHEAEPVDVIHEGPTLAGMSFPTRTIYVPKR